jgi:SAM-dependent MidA family methyltransferase
VPVGTDPAFADGPLPWARAWHLAAHGDTGFWSSGSGTDGPATHFRTSAHVGTVLARALAVLLNDVDARLGHPQRLDVVDLGAGRGELLTTLLDAVDPELRRRLAPVAIDVLARPADLDERVTWVTGEVPDAVPADVHGLLLAHELLDEVPLDVVQVDDEGRVRLVLVDADGTETLGPVADDADDLAWLAAWWPVVEPGDRAELGRPRDDVWARCVARLVRGTALAVDYGHTRDERVAGRYDGGTLSAYRDGRQVEPVPDGRANLTAHVALDSVAAAVGGRPTAQRAALRALGIRAAVPASPLAAHEPSAYADALQDASDAAELLDPSGLGAFVWVRVDR